LTVTFFLQFPRISHQKDPVSFPWDKQKSPNEISSLGVNKWKVLTDAAWKIGAKGLESTLLKVLCILILFYPFPLQLSIFLTNIIFHLFRRVVVH
jgi:hypothetical protein